MLLFLFQRAVQPESDATTGLLVILVMLVIGVLSLAFYVLPSAIALWRDHPQVGPIMLINLLAGWTFIGWIIAIAWSVSYVKPKHPPRVAPPQPAPPQYNYQKIR